MGYQFTNNWPYSLSLFPSMDEHVDPVNNEYFAGLMTELTRIEYYLGLHPQGSDKDIAERLSNLDALIQSNDDNIWNTLHIDVAEDFSDVKDKLENHGHSGGTDGKLLVVPVPGVWEDVDFVGTRNLLEIDPADIGGSTAGFAYFNLIYLGPCERGAGTRYIQCYNPTTDEHTWQATAAAQQPRGGLFNGTYGFFSLGGSPGKIVRFTPDTWEEVITSLHAGVNYPGHLVKEGTLVWGASYTSPSYIFRYNPSSHVTNEWLLDASLNECRAMCSDGTYIWTCCNTNPVKLVRFKISDKSHTDYTLTGFLPEVIYMFYYDGMVYMFSNNATQQWCRYNPAILGFQRWETEFPGIFKAGAQINDAHIFTLYDASDSRLLIFEPGEFSFHLSKSLGGIGSMDWITFVPDHVVWFYGNYKDVEAALTLL